MSSETILVTGGAGYLGCTLVPLLLAQGRRVRVIDSLHRGNESAVEAIRHPSFEFVHSDIRDNKALHSAFDGIDAVVHLAAVVGDSACAKDPILARETNLEASLNLFDECRRKKISTLVFASTCSNYGGSGESDAFVDENSALAPLSLYAETKVQCEQALLTKDCMSQLRITAMRLATLYGVSPRMRFDLTVNDFTMQMHIKKRLVVFGAQSWRPYVHVLDAARAICHILDQPDKLSGQVYNVGCTIQNYRKIDIVKMVQERIPDSDVAFMDQKKDPRNYRVDFGKISRDLDFRCTRTVEGGILEIIRLLQMGVIREPEHPMFRN